MIPLGRSVAVSCTLLLAILMLLLPALVVGQEDSALTIYVPGAKGGGFDRTAQAVKQALETDEVYSEVSLINSPGAGGLVALAQFAERGPSKEPAVIIGGRSILGASRFNRSEVSLDDVRAVARLNTIALVIAVSANSPIESIEDLAIAMRGDAELVKWGGGSSGSVDEQLALEIASALGVSASDVSYSAVPGGGEQIAQDLMSGKFVVAISSYEEFASALSEGSLRPIAVSGASRINGVDAPTLMESGLDLQFRDWKGVFAGPGQSDQQIEALEQIFQKMARSKAWQDQLLAHGWQDGFLGAGAFEEFVQSEIGQVAAQGDEAINNADTFAQIRDVMARANRWLWGVGGLLLLLICWLVFQRWGGRQKEAELRSSLDAVSEENRRVSKELERQLSETTGKIESDFKDWNLSDAEIAVGWLILKGFSFQEIADNRQTSERTVRQQAQAIYNKAGLSGRSELSAFFLEDFFDRGLS